MSVKRMEQYNILGGKFTHGLSMEPGAVNLFGNMQDAMQGRINELAQSLSVIAQWAETNGHCLPGENRD